MKNIKTYNDFLNEANLDMLNTHGITDGKLEMEKEYLWLETKISHEQESKLSPIKVIFKGMINDEWGKFQFQENKNDHKINEYQKIEIHSIYPLDLKVDGFNNPTNYK